MRVLGVLVLLVLVAGCVQTPPSEETGQPTTSPADADGLLAHSLDFAGCDELDFYFPADVSGIDMGGLEPVYVDPADELANVLVTAMACDAATVNDTTVTDPTAFFIMISVEPSAELRYDNVSAYVWIAGMVTESQALIDGFGPRLDHEEGTVTLTFSAAGPNEKARAALTMDDGPGPSTWNSVMSGSPSDGQSGTMAAYIGDSKNGLELFLLSFSDYTFYANGAAFGESVTGFVPAPADPSQLYPAYHNLGYDVRFERAPPG